MSVYKLLGYNVTNLLLPIQHTYTIYSTIVHTYNNYYTTTIVVYIIYSILYTNIAIIITKILVLIIQ